MGSSFKYTLGINELSSKKHRLPNALLAEFVGEYKRRPHTHTHKQTRAPAQIDDINIYFSILFFFSVHRNLFVEFLRMLGVHIWRSHDDIIRIWTHHFRCCDGNKNIILFIPFHFDLKFVCIHFVPLNDCGGGDGGDRWHVRHALQVTPICVSC